MRCTHCDGVAGPRFEHDTRCMRSLVAPCMVDIRGHFVWSFAVVVIAVVAFCLRIAIASSFVAMAFAVELAMVG